MWTEAIGWVSTLVLLATLATQVHKQWRTQSSEGISRWLFAGQIAASAGFAIYSLLLGSWVFLLTNCAILASAVIGQLIYLRTTAARAQEALRAHS